MAVHNAARERREKELADLAAEGVTVIRVNPWHFRVGSLHVWIASGRWLDEDTGNRGRLYGVSIRAVLAQYLKTKASSNSFRRKYSCHGNALAWVLEVRLWPQLPTNLRAHPSIS